MKKLLDKIGVWTIKHHWIILLVTLGGQWLTGQIIGEPREWGWIMDYRLARQLHQLIGKLILLLLVYMAGNKTWLYFKRQGKI